MRCRPGIISSFVGALRWERESKIKARMKMEQEIAMIRPACAEDTAAMADLFGQLGYPVSPQVLRDRWLAPDPAREVLVACLGTR